jgi:hypothetical protein
MINFNRGIAATVLLCLSFSSFAAQEWLHFFPASDNANQQGFIRVTNVSDVAGTVTISGVDDAGVTSTGTISIDLAADQTVHFNSQDSEDGNTDKGLVGFLDNGTGTWRLLFDSDVDLAVSGLFRNATGFVNNVHNTAEEVDGLRHDVPFLNPASNTNQVSRLRLINTSSASNDFTITAIDDAGVAGQEPVRITIAPKASAELSSIDLEQGASNTTGSFGDRAGKWRLEVESTPEARVMSLLEDPNGNLSNLSLPAVPDVDGKYVLNYMLPLDVDAQSFLRIINPNESATTVTVSGIDDAGNAAPGGDITIDLAANETVNFRSEFYEGGNESIGLQGSLGDGEGNWRLIISSTQNVTVMGLFRTPLGFLNVLHDNLTTVPATTHTASIFNPGSNANQVSLLRLNNLEDVSNTFTITGIDDDGDAADASVDEVVAAMESVMISAETLESAGLGNGDGKWQLNVTSTGLSYTQSVLQAPDNFLSNLSTKLDVSDLAEGFFLDSPVANVDYRTATRTGSTDGTGRFTYNPSETVTFHIGDLDFPSAGAQRYVTPLTLADTDNPRDSRVVNMLRLLQTLDKDGNPDNGITISDMAKSNASQVDFDLSESDFENSSDVTNLVTNGGQDTPPCRSC